MVKLVSVLAAGAFALVAVQAQAATVFTQSVPTGELTSPGSISYSFSAGTGAGSVSFNIDGYRTLDGAGSGFSCGAACDDVFTLSLNNIAIYSAAFVLGGAGFNQVFFKPLGATEAPLSYGFNQGGFADLFVPLNLVNGINTLTFAYTGVAQGSGDEAFGINNLVVSGTSAAAVVPEPATWAMMIGGFGLIGGAMRRRRKVRTAVRFA